MMTYDLPNRMLTRDAVIRPVAIRTAIFGNVVPFAKPEWDLGGGGSLFYFLLNRLGRCRRHHMVGLNILASSRGVKTHISHLCERGDRVMFY